VSTNVVKWSEGLSNRVPIIFRRYTDQIKLAAGMAVFYIIILKIFRWFYFLSLYIELLFDFVNCVCLLLC
jgi:hypothetical protein